MFNPPLIQATFQGLVGMLQPNDPNVPQIPTGSALLQTDTGLYMQNIHPLVTIDNLYFAAPDFTIYKWSSWVSGQAYVATNIINFTDGNLYKCILGVTSATTPPNDATHWVIYTPFLNWLTQLYKQASTNYIGEIVKRKKLLKMGKALLEKQELYRGYGNQNSLIVGLGRAVGFELKPAAVDGLLMQINQIGVQLSAAQSELNMYLYHTSQAAPLNIFHVNGIAKQTFDWQPLTDCILGFKTNNTDTSGVYYLVYYEADLTGQAVGKTWDFTTAPCPGCDNVNAAAYNKWSKYTRIRTIEVAPQHLDPARNIFDYNYISYNNNTNYGLNLSISVRCDLTQRIIDTRLLFGDGFAKQLAYEALKVIAYSSRVNPYNDKVNKMAMADLDPKVSGSFILDWNDAIDATNMDLTGFSKSCMPEDDTATIKWGSV